VSAGGERLAATAQPVSDETRLAVLVRRPGPRPRVLPGFTQEQADKARLLLADGGLVPSGHPGVWWVASSSGELRYLAHADACNCPAGLHDRRCYHSAAVRLIEAGGAIATAARHYRQARRWQNLADESLAAQRQANDRVHEFHARQDEQGAAHWRSRAAWWGGRATNQLAQAARMRELARAATELGRKATS
jgi:hypothetical protein